jgi:hypothetical protein
MIEIIVIHVIAALVVTGICYTSEWIQRVSKRR